MKHVVRSPNPFPGRRRCLLAAASLAAAVILSGSSAVAVADEPAGTAPESGTLETETSETDTSETGTSETGTSETSTPPADPPAGEAPPPGTPSQTPPPSPPDDVVETGDLYVSVFEVIDGEPSIIPNLDVTFTERNSGASYRSPTPATVTLPVGDYIVSLDTVPDGFRVVSIPRVIHLRGDGGHAQIVLERIPGPVPAGQFTLTKLDRTDGTPLAGARFRFDTCDGWAVLEAVTDAAGQIEEQVPVGCYVATEIAAPHGFVPEQRSYTFTVSSLRLTGLQVYNLPVDYTAPRAPERRYPLSSVPAGPTQRP